MKRLLLILAVALAAVSCSKESTMKGSYIASSSYGTVYLELLDDGNCVGHFDGNEERTGVYHFEGDKISIALLLRKGKMTDYNYKAFALESGTVLSSSSIAIDGYEMYSKEKIHLTFIKR